MRRFLPLAAVVLSAACASWRWSGFPPPDGRASDSLHPPPVAAGPEIEPVKLATSTYTRHPTVAVLPEPTPLKQRTAVFYSDLGPDELDISSYPLQQRSNYRAYAQACARCHDLSRSLYAPHTSGPWLNFYLTSMRVRGRFRGRPFTQAELQAVRDFLNFDAKERKTGDAREFEAQTEQLKRRFDALISERMEKLQKNAPAPSPARP
jgi:hypothetical protein